MRTRALPALALLALIAGPVLALPRSTDDEPLASIRVPDVGASMVSASPSGVVLRPTVSPLWSDGRPQPTRPDVHVPEPPVIVTLRTTEKRATGNGSTVSGIASWFCGHGSPCTRGYPGGLYAAAGPALRVGAWRGRTVVVAAGLSRVRVQLIDWCACPNGRVLDLYSDAFERLGPLSRGVLNVSVSW